MKHFSKCFALCAVLWALCGPQGLLAEQVYDDQTANDTSGTLVQTYPLPESPVVFIDGVFDGCTVTVELSPDGETWFTDTDLTFTNATTNNVQYMVVMDPTNKVKVRARLTSAGGSTNIDLWIE